MSHQLSSKAHEGISRRSFLGTSVIAAGALSVGRARSADEVELKIKATAPGFTADELKLLNGAVWELQQRFLSQDIRQLLNRSDAFGRINTSYLAESQLLKRKKSIDKDVLKDILPLQLTYLENLTFPKLEIVGYNDGDNGIAGWAYINTVPLLFPNRDENPDSKPSLKGDFQVNLNRYYMTDLTSQDAANYWAGVIAHEMLHNLGHEHDKGEYGLEIQINYFTKLIEFGKAPTAKRLNFGCASRVKR